jgi:hypothetical protein
MLRSFPLSAILFVGLICLTPLGAGAEESAAAARKTDAFFAGTVAESTPEKLTVARTVLGKNETRSFVVNADTKVEGTLSAKARVTVRYTTDDSGDTALLIVVRAPDRPAAKKK